MSFRFATCVLVLSLLAGAIPADAQQPHDTASAQLSAAARSAVDIYNAAATTRVTGAFDVPASKVIEGSVAVLNGPVTIAGRIEGTLVAINADVRLAPGATVQGELIVVGGTIGGADSAHIAGGVREQPELFRYRLENDQLLADREPVYDESWWRRHNVKHDFRNGAAYTDFFFIASQAYDRVEGWSVIAGPRFQRFPEWGKINVETFGVVRTAAPVQWDSRTLGHELKAEVQFGKPLGVAIGAHAFNAIAPTESWQLGGGEVGLASAILREDFRDYYSRHGGELYLRLQGGDDADLTFLLSDEQWGDVRERDPWSLARAGEPWRPNPFMDAGAMHLFTTRLRVDTRERYGSPWQGWYVTGELENGVGNLTRLGAPILTVMNPIVAPSPEGVNYLRAFFDIRRFNKLTPDTYLNLRLVTGGWLGGDPLPTERRIALGGPGSLPGYGFRELDAGPDVLQCTRGLIQPGTPGQCDRMILLQAELRAPFLAGSLRDDGPDDWWRPGFNRRFQWVLFADAGRGWNVGAPTDDGVTYRASELPELDTWKTDLGAGIDFGGLGVYLAKALKDHADPIRVTLRLQHRF